MTTTDYKKQATDFLNSTSTSFEIRFKEYGQMSWDKNTNNYRNIYWVVLKNKLGRYAFDFGQSIEGTKKKQTPTAYDVLACLTKYNPATFEYFCDNYGYDNDSREAKRTYKAVVKEWQAIEKMFSAEQIEVLQEIQ